MRAVQFVRPIRLRWLAVSLLAAAGTLAWRAAHRPPAPPPEPPIITCAIPAVDPAPAPEPQHFAQPPPGDPRTQLVEAELVDRPSAVGDCGSFLIETTMTFRPLKSIGFADLRVLVPCAEMTRAQFGGPDAGTAGILRIGRRYMLTLREATDVPDGKNATLYRAVRIDARTPDLIPTQIEAQLISRDGDVAVFDPGQMAGEGHLRVLVPVDERLSVGVRYDLDISLDDTTARADWRAVSIFDETEVLY